MTISALRVHAEIKIAELRRIAAESHANVARLENSVYEPRCYVVRSVEHLLQAKDNVAPVVVKVGDVITSTAVVSYNGVTTIKFQQGGNTAWTWLSHLESAMCDDNNNESEK